MNLRNMANRYTRRVNPNVPATLKRSTGYTTAPDGKQVPAYADPEPISIQMQALQKSEIEHLDRLNISNAQASVFADTQLSNGDRPSQTGGDLIEFGTDAKVPATLRGTKWLVVAMLEGWPGSGWCKAAVTGQMP